MATGPICVRVSPASLARRERRCAQSVRRQSFPCRRMGRVECRRGRLVGTARTDRLAINDRRTRRYIVNTRSVGDSAKEARRLAGEPQERRHSPPRLRFGARRRCGMETTSTNRCWFLQPLDRNDPHPAKESPAITRRDAQINHLRQNPVTKLQF